MATATVDILLRRGGPPSTSGQKAAGGSPAGKGPAGGGAGGGAAVSYTHLTLPTPPYV